MKIFCITDITTTTAGTPFPWYILPDSSTVRSHNPFFIPDFDTLFMGAPVLVLKVSRLGKSIASKFAHRYFEECTLGVTVWGETLLKELMAKGEYPAPALCFDKCFWLGEFMAKDTFANAVVELTIGDVPVKLALKDTYAAIPEIVTQISRNNALKMGDLIAVRLPYEFGLEAGGVCIKNGESEILEIRVK